MTKFVTDYILPIFNIIYKIFPSFYVFIYFIYKQVSEKEKISFLKENIKVGDTVIDVGANVGFYTKIFAKLVGKSGKVYAFEPDKKNFKLLSLNLKGFKNTKLFKMAVGDKNGVIKLYESSSRNTDHQTYNIGDERNHTNVKSVKIDSMSLNLDGLKLIKLDVQGYDYFALKGMKRILKKTKDVIIFGEIWPYGLIKSGSSASFYLSFIKSLGFRIQDSKISDNNLNKYNTDKYYYTDFIAKKP